MSRNNCGSDLGHGHGRVAVTGRPRSATRLAGRAWAAQVLDTQADALGWSTCDLARALGLSEVRARAIRSGERALEVGDLIALGALGRAVAEAVLAETEPLVPSEEEQLVAEVRYVMATYLATDARPGTDRGPVLLRVLDCARAMLRALSRRE